MAPDIGELFEIIKETIVDTLEHFGIDIDGSKDELKNWDEKTVTAVTDLLKALNNLEKIAKDMNEKYKIILDLIRTASLQEMMSSGNVTTTMELYELTQGVNAALNSVFKALNLLIEIVPEVHDILVAKDPRFEAWLSNV